VRYIALDIIWPGSVAPIDSEDPDVAVLQLTPEMENSLKKWSSLLALLQLLHPAIHSIEIWDQSPTVLMRSAVPEQYRECLDNEAGVADVDALPEGNVEARIECMTAHVDEQGIYWELYPKHLDVQLRTMTLKLV